MALQKPLVRYLLRLGDNALILGQRLSEWIGHAPAIEEELGTANIALDLIGQSRLWLALAGTEEGMGRDEDKLAYLRDAGEFRNVLLVEQPNGDFAQTIARQLYFDAWHGLLLEHLALSSDQRVAEIAGKAVREVEYHLRRSRDWAVALGDGTEESHRRMQRAVDDLWMYTGEMFDSDDADTVLIQTGVVSDPGKLREPWQACIADVLRTATLEQPSGTFMQKGGIRGAHSEHLGYLLADMQFLQRAYPNSTW